MMFRTCLVICLLLSTCNSTNVIWDVHSGHGLSADEKNSILELAGMVGFDSVYAVEVGVWDKYDSSIAAVVKQVGNVNDTLKQEKWLYIWKKKWVDSQLFRSFGDSTIKVDGFVSGKTAVRVVNSYLYRYGNEQKEFRFATSRGNYLDVKTILDCIKSGNAIEKKRKFREETDAEWDIMQKNLLEFREVTCWGRYYSFDYSFESFPNPDMVLKAKRIGDKCEIMYAGPRGAGGK